MAPETTVVPLDLSVSEREQVRGALALAEANAEVVLPAPIAGQATAALRSLSRAFERNDRRAVESGLADAREVIARHHSSGVDAVGDPELEVLTLTLDQLAALIASSLNPQDRQP